MELPRAGDIDDRRSSAPVVLSDIFVVRPATMNSISQYIVVAERPTPSASTPSPSVRRRLPVERFAVINIYASTLITPYSGATGFRTRCEQLRQCVKVLSRLTRHICRGAASLSISSEYSGPHTVPRASSERNSRQRPTPRDNQQHHCRLKTCPRRTSAYVVQWRRGGSARATLAHRRSPVVRSLRVRVEHRRGSASP